MSLIQQALEKTSRSQETQTTTSVPAPKNWARDPMGATLERELIRVQEDYAKRRSFLEKVFLTILLVSLVGIAVYYGTRNKQPDAGLPRAAAGPCRPAGSFAWSVTAIRRGHSCRDTRPWRTPTNRCRRCGCPKYSSPRFRLLSRSRRFRRSPCC